MQTPQAWGPYASYKGKWILYPIFRKEKEYIEFLMLLNIELKLTKHHRVTIFIINSQIGQLSEVLQNAINSTTLHKQKRIQVNAISKPFIDNCCWTLLGIVTNTFMYDSMTECNVCVAFPIRAPGSGFCDQWNLSWLGLHE